MSIYLQRKQLARKITLSFLVILLSGLLVAFLAGFLVFVDNLPKEKNTPVLNNVSFDGIIAYTGGQYRLGTTALIIKDGFKGPVLVTGAYPDVDIKNIFNKLGLEPEQMNQINVDYSAISTAGNVQQTINWAKSNNLRTVLIITSYYHLPRTELLLSKQEDSVEFIYYPVFSNNASFKLLFAEYVKFLLLQFNLIIKLSLQSQLPY